MGYKTQVWECAESGELIEGNNVVCADVMARDSELHWRLVNEWPETAEEAAHAESVAVGWLLRLRQLQAQGHSFNHALSIANAEYPEG